MVSVASFIRLRRKSIRLSVLMHNRIDDCFARLFSERRKGFIPYICAGDPTLKRTVDLAFALEKSGADLLELGVPFSDPLADGIVNQLAAQRALSAGATVRGVLETVRNIRAKTETPIVLYTRSEEHTSELQSPDHLVCRLLLEKKKYHTKTMSRH